MSTRERRGEPQPAHLPMSSPEDVGAIAVDTNVYKEYGFRVRSQPLAALGQVEDIGVKWLVPEFWERELQRHIAENSDKVSTLRRDLEKSREWANKSQLALAEKLVAALTTESGQSIGNRLLDEHYESGAPVRLQTAWSSGPNVLRAYFDSQHPFEASGSKKSEFPDAFALATLEAWARKNATKVLVVTRDAGCLRACAATDVLVGSNSLTEALGALRKADERRKAVIDELEVLLTQELRSDVSDLRKAIDAYLEKIVPDLELEVTFQEESGADCDHEVTYVWVDRIEPMGTADGRLHLRIFTATVGGLTFVCDFRVHVDATAQFAKLYRGSRSSSSLHDAPEENGDGTVELEVIVTLQPAGALSARTLPHASIRNVEVRVLETDIDFGTIRGWEPGYEE